MLLIIVRIFYAFVCAGAIATYISSPPRQFLYPTVVDTHTFATFIVMLALTQVFTVIDILFRRKSIRVISAVYFGLMVGILLSFLFILGVSPLIGTASVYNYPFQLLTFLVFPYLCISLILQTQDDFRFVIPYVEFSRSLKGGSPWILDSSALIDGRIADFVETNVVDAQLIVPKFVLLEVQDIADSSDKMRRSRGRRGLEVLSKLQNSPKTDVLMHETKQGEFKGMSVDQRLVELGKQLEGRVVTNDYNLNKVAGLQGVTVINLNDVANVLKPRYLPGERVRIKILKEGESQGQGVGYLDDGTMVVCEQSNHLVGQDIDVIVTSVLQSSAGRMIFGRQVHSTSQNN
jgi:uncharacterized protein YacL